MSSFNVVQILPALDSGGVERGTIDVANYLSELKIKNYIISNGGKLIYDLNCTYTNHYKLSVNSKNFFLYPFLAKKIEKIIKSNGINIVHVRSRAPSWIINFMRKDKIRTISTFHNVYDGKNFIKKIYNKGLANVDHIVAISDYVKEEIINKYHIDPKKITTINRGVDIINYNKKILDHELEIIIKKFNIDINKKIILFPARLTSWKGQIEFLQVVKEISKENIAVYFIGDYKNSSYTHLLQKKIKEFNLENICKIVGNLDFNDLKIMYSLSDLVVSFPLRPEGFGRVISEALCMQKMVLAFNYGGVKNQLANLDQIFKTEPLVYQSLGSKIKNILNLNKEKKFNLTLEAQQYVAKHFSKSEMLKKYKEIYAINSI